MHRFANSQFHFQMLRLCNHCYLVSVRRPERYQELEPLLNQKKINLIPFKYPTEYYLFLSFLSLRISILRKQFDLNLILMQNTARAIKLRDKILISFRQIEIRNEFARTEKRCSSKHSVWIIERDYFHSNFLTAFYTCARAEAKLTIFIVPHLRAAFGFILVWVYDSYTAMRELYSLVFA